MIKKLAIIAAASALTACWGAPPNERLLTQQCIDLFDGDSRSERMISDDAKTDTASFCACYAAQAVTNGVVTDLHKDILVTMNEIKSADNLDVEDTADRIDEALEAGDITSFTEIEFEGLGDYFQALASSMNETGGSCPAS